MTCPEIIEVVAIGLDRRRVSGASELRMPEHAPITRLGRSMMSLRIEKQKVQGTGAPDGLSRTQ